MSIPQSAYAYDRNFRLRPPFLLWLVALWSCRHLIALMPTVVIGLGALTPLLADWRMVAGDLIAGLVMIANGFRLPDAHPLMRSLWRHGRAAMTLALLASLGSFFWLHWVPMTQPLHSQHDAVLWLLTGDVLGLIYVVRSRRLTAVFADVTDGETTTLVEGSGSKPSGTLMEHTIVSGALIHAEIISGSAAIMVNSEPSLTVDDLMRRAAAAHDAGRVGESEQWCRAALAHAPEFADGWHALGLLALGEGKWQQAAALVRQAVVFDDGNPIFRCNLCEIYRRVGRLPEAIRFGREAVQRAPRNTDAQYNLALALADAGQRDEAIATYRQAIAINPALPQAWNNLGVLLRQAGDDIAARYAFKQALIIAPGHPAAQTNLGD